MLDLEGPMDYPTAPFIFSFMIPLPGALSFCQVDRLSPHHTGLILRAQENAHIPQARGHYYSQGKCDSVAHIEHTLCDSTGEKVQVLIIKSKIATILSDEQPHRIFL